MPVIPEKHLLSQIGHVISAQARGQEETSPSTLSALTRRRPGEPSPLPQKLPSGISRTEQLLGLQRYLNFPFVPSFVGGSGGLVLDRVVHTLGSRGSSWWATVTARLRAQRAWQQQKNQSRGKGGGHREPGPATSTSDAKKTNALLDPTNYALSIQTNSRVSKSTSVCANLDFDDFNQVVSLANGRESDVPLRVQAELKQKLPLHQLTAEALLHGQFTTSDHGLIQVPRVLSVDIASDSRKSGLRYQGGLFQIVSNTESEDIMGQHVTKLQTSQFLHCAATVEKDFVLWKGSRRQRGSGKKKSRSLSPFELAYSTRTYTTELKKRLKQQRDVASKPLEKPSTDDKGNKAEGAREKKRLPYSTLLHKPYLSFGGVAGFLAQAKLHSETTDGLGNVETSTPKKDGASILRSIPTLWSLGDESFWTTRRLFASAGVNMQLGNFSKNLLDFTSVSLKLDTGMPFPSPSSSLADANAGEKSNSLPALQHSLLGEYKQRKHTVSTSIAQQLFGPIRVRADARYEIELHQPSLKGPLMDQLKSVVRVPENASKPEIVYGLDWHLPYVSGAARLSVWYSPTRREGLGEIRLL